jgi:hypothetical protein
MCSCRWGIESLDRRERASMRRSKVTRCESDLVLVLGVEMGMVGICETGCWMSSRGF